MVILLLGTNWPVMSVALRSVSPIWMAALRLTAAAATLFVLTGVSGRLARPPRQDLPIVLSVAAFRLAAVMLLVFFALEIVPPGRSSILTWTTALWTVPIAVLILGERMNPLRWMGLAAGLSGILLVFEPTRLDWSDGRVILGHFMLLGAAMSQASVSVHVRQHVWKATPLALLPWQMLTAAIPIVAVAFLKEGLPPIDWSYGLVANVVFQGVFVSGLGMWGQLTVLRSHPAISTNLLLMGVPVVGLLSSALFLGEALTIFVVGGLVLVALGVTASKIADSWS